MADGARLNGVAALVLIGGISGTAMSARAQTLPADAVPLCAVTPGSVGPPPILDSTAFFDVSPPVDAAGHRTLVPHPTLKLFARDAARQEARSRRIAAHQCQRGTNDRTGATAAGPHW
jgi:hypothetical protein